ncbi:MAG: hypothetical protein KDI46_00685 [Alphaproteobacteria bacterium]|nr:hypothetical protein [Alphaproteobacteria bacterium]
MSDKTKSGEKKVAVISGRAWKDVLDKNPVKPSAERGGVDAALAPVAPKPPEGPTTGND